MDGKDAMRLPYAERRELPAELEYTHGGKDYVAEVGQAEPRTGEPVLVILGSNAYLVCTRKHAVARGEPIMVGGPRQSVDFN